MGSPPAEGYRCPWRCGYHGTWEALLEHARSVHLCDRCEFGGTAEQLMQHRARVHHERPLRCGNPDFYAFIAGLGVVVLVIVLAVVLRWLL